MATRKSLQPLTRDDLREELSLFRKDLRFDFVTKKEHKKTTEEIIKKIDEKGDTIIEAVGELYGRQIRHAQQAIVELADHVDATDLKGVRRVQADLG